VTQALPPIAFVAHGVADVPLRRDRHRLFVSPALLADHIGRIRSWGYEFVTFGELAERVKVGSPEGLCALTFDDGFADNLDCLVPLLEREQATATVFAVSGWLGCAHPHAPYATTLDAAGLRALAAHGVEIGAHSMAHRDLTTLTFKEVLEDLTRSRRELETIVGGPVTVAAYPYGRASADVERACLDAGFRGACVTSPHGSWTNPFAIPRQSLANACTGSGLWLKRHDRYEAAMRWFPARAARRARLRVLAWRQG
jgi:peptidoglycan/xylan/chitin deacetylase (PgdA/CDA1 family)